MIRRPPRSTRRSSDLFSRFRSRTWAAGCRSGATKARRTSSDCSGDRMSVFSLSGKTALVAGASRGIGLAIAQQLAEAGARTMLAARSVDKLREHAEALVAKGFEASALHLDMADSGSIRAALE